MPALNRDLTIEQGTTWAHGFQVTVNGEPITAAWTVRSHIRTSARATDVLHEWSTESGNAAVADGGIVTLALEPADSTAWDWRTGCYDIEVTSPDELVYRVAAGLVRVDAEVTRG